MQLDSTKGEESATASGTGHGLSTNSGNDGKLLCLTVYSYKREDLDYEQYQEHMLGVHARLASTLMENYGIVGFTMVSPFSLSLTVARQLLIGRIDAHEQHHTSSAC